MKFKQILLESLEIFSIAFVMALIVSFFIEKSIWSFFPICIGGILGNILRHKIKDK